MKAENERYTVAVDFDGVIHSYTSPWVDAATIPDPPVPGAIRWLSRIIQNFNVAITSTRNHQLGGIVAMQNWLHEWAGSDWYDQPEEGYLGIGNVTFPAHKPAALIYLDDRAVRFDGENFPEKDEIHRLRPWNKEATRG